MEIFHRFILNLSRILMRNFKHIVVLFASLVASVVSTACAAGDAVCHDIVGPSSWCKEDGTCQGRPEVECTCSRSTDADIVRPMTPAPVERKPVKKCELNHELCIREVGAHSWCRENETCKDGAHIACGCDTLPDEISAADVPPPDEITDGTCDADAVCTAMDAGSWCREDKTCQGHPSVSCACSSLLPPASVSHGSSLASPRDRSFVLWAEWPTLEMGEWPAYFGKLLSFIESNCGNLRVHRVVMRILDPEFQSERGELWQVSTSSSFYTDFMRHLPSNVEVHIYPYLLEKASASRWSQAMMVHVPLEATFKFVSHWNALLEDAGAEARIAGVVTDKEEGRNFLSDMEHLGDFKDRYSTPGAARLRFGLTLGFDSVGSIHGTSPEVDDFYIEMYDFYIEGISPAVVVEAHDNGALNNPDRFLAILDEKVWPRHLHRYNTHENIVFMWSLQDRQSTDCNYPLPDETCGERVDMGSWRVEAFNEFLDILSAKHPVFTKRDHGLFQFNYVPTSWQTCRRRGA